jgi:hypothetical protein
MAAITEIPHKSNRNKQSLIVLFLFFVSLVLVALSAITNFYPWSEELPTHILLLTAVLALLRESMKSNLTAIYFAGLAFLGSGWIFEFFAKSASVSYPSGFPFNPLGERFLGLSAHPNTAGFLCVVVFTISLFAFSNYPAALFSISTLILTENRGGLLSTFLIFSIWMVAFPKKTNLVAKVSSIAVFLVATFQLFSGNRAGNQDVTSGRGDIWSVCLAKISENHFLGFGPRSIAREFGLDQVDWFRPFHCHNQVLDDAVNFGVLAATLSLFVLIAVIVKSFRSRDFALLSIFVAFMIFGLFEVPVRWFVAPGYIWLEALYVLATINIIRNNTSTTETNLVGPQGKRSTALNSTN